MADTIALATERIARLVSEAKNTGEHINRIATHLTESMTVELGETVLQEHKTIDKCWDFIMGRAKDKLKRTSGCLAETVVLPWAVEYFMRDDAQEERKKAEEKHKREEEAAERTKKAKAEQKTKEAKKAATRSVKDNQVSLFDMMGDGHAE